MTKSKIKTATTKVYDRARGYLAARPHRSFKRTKNQKLGGQPLPRLWPQLKSVVGLIRREKRIMLSLGLIYVVLNFVLVGGLSQDSFVGLKEAALQLISGDFGSFGTAFTLFTSIVSGTVAAPSELQQFIGGLLAFVFWLAIIWALRMRLADQSIKVRDALYNSGSPIVPSFMIMLAVTVQALPAVLGIYVLSTAQAQGWLQGVEAMAFWLAGALLFMLSAYWVLASLMALVVVTLPQTYPWRALSTASSLVVGQRLRLALHVLALLLYVLVLWAVVLVPTLLLDDWLKFDWLPLVPIVSQLLSGLSLVFFTTYVYKLYRSLL